MSTNDAGGVRDDDDGDEEDEDKIIIPTLSDPLAAAILREDVVELERLLLLLRNNRTGGGDEDEDEDEEEEDGPAHVNYRVPPIITNVTKNTPLLLLLAVGPSPVVHTHMVQLLLDYGNAEDVDMGDSFHGITPLMAACNMENETLVELLLQPQKQKQKQKHQRGVGGGGGANPNAQSADGKTALIQMAKRGHLDLVKLLLRYGANPSIYDEQAKNALMYACSENRIDVVRYLVCFAKEQQQQRRKESSSSSSSAAAAAAGVNDYKVDPPLWYACAAGHSEIVQFLLQAGAKIEYRLEGTIYSTTPLMEACEWGHYEVVKLLLEQGGAEVANLTGRKALALARRSGYHKVAQLMEFWTKRLRALQSFVSLEASVVLNNNNEDSVPASLVPLILGQTGRRPDLTHAILSLRMDVLANRRCWN